MDIREIHEADLSGLARLYTEVFSQEPWNEPWTESKAYDRLAHFFHSKGFVGLVAHNANQPIGMLMGTKEPFHIGMLFYLREMCIIKDLQNKGLGAEIMSALVNTLKSQGIVGQYLTTDKAIPAASFYEKQGFERNTNMGFYFQQLTDKENLQHEK